MQDKHAAADFLAALDPAAEKFTFQFFGDGAERPAIIRHGTLDDVWASVEELNTPDRRMGVFVTINETNLQGRRRENIVRARALFVDADDADQLRRCEEVIRATGVAPSIIVRTSPNRAHFYWFCDDIPLEEFSTLQAALIAKLETDPAVKDLSRVMRLPGTLHLKDPAAPQRVTLEKLSSHRWKVCELTAALGLSALSTGGRQTTGARSSYLAGNMAYTRADAEQLRRRFGPEYLADADDLGAGLET